MGFQKFGRFLLVMMALQSYQASPLERNQDDKTSFVKIIPKGYALNIQPFPDEETYAGEVAINIAFLETTNVITLNAHKNLTVEDTEVILSKSNGGGQRDASIKIEKTEKPDETNTFSIILEKNINAGSECEVKIKFSGLLNTHKAEGLFKKTYVDATTGQTKWIIGSNLYPNFTSTAFPCIDDPSFKVPFDVSIQRPSELNSASTMSVLRSADMGTGWVKDVYATTPPMAAVSLAIFVSDLTPLISNKPDLQIRIWSTPEISKNVKEGLSEMILNSLKAYEEYFGVKYPLPKLDYVALPSLANTYLHQWGLIISNHDNFGSGNGLEKYSISSELTNQWIGNLVTPSLKEEDNMVSALTHFSSLSNAKTIGGEADYYVRGWPISGFYSTYYELGNPSPRDDEVIRRMVRFELYEMVYRMLAYSLTEQTYSAALQKFIKNKQFKTFKMEDFWDALTKQAHADGNLPSDMTVKDVATSWSNKYRLPLITVTRNYNAHSALLTQSLFIRKRPRSIVQEDENLLWTIPIVLTAQNKLNFANTKPTYWMKDRELNAKNVADSKEFIIVNPEEIAGFMVNYDKTNWNMLADFLQSAEQRAKIPIITRAKLVHDALNLAYAGTLDFGTALNMTLFLKDETDSVVWRPFFVMFDHITRHIDGTKALKKYQSYTNILVKPVYDRIKSTNSSQDARFLLNDAEHTLRSVGNEQFLKESNAAYEKWMRNPSKHYNLVSKHLCTIYEFGTNEQWEFGLKTLQNLKDKPEIERDYLFKSVVGCTRDHRRIHKFLNMVIFEQNDLFTDRDIDFALSMLTGGSGYMAVFEYLSDNWKILKENLQNKPETWTQLIYTATSLYKTQEGLNKVSELYSKHRGEFGDAETTIQDSLKKIKEEVKWTNDNMGTLEDWLDDFILKNSPQN